MKAVKNVEQVKASSASLQSSDQVLFPAVHNVPSETSIAIDFYALL
ncbi:MAG: hypothetical protein HC767_07565 [Akkermansiaceae bacterium]|nr:hypothetical protein [Akkermansiaceae bacterium]